MATAPNTVKNLSFNGYTVVLLRYLDGQPALWVRDEYLAGRSEAEGIYTLNDINESSPLGADEDLDEVVAAWKQAVGWDDNTRPEVLVNAHREAVTAYREAVRWGAVARPDGWVNARRVTIECDDGEGNTRISRGWELLENIEGYCSAGQLWFDGDDESTEPAGSWIIEEEPAAR